MLNEFFSFQLYGRLDGSRPGEGDRLFDWLTSVISDGGYLGIVLLMLAENLFPPIPSELIMPLAGFVAAKGELNVGLVVLAGVLGSMLGALPWYYAGRWVGEARMRAFAARHGRWLTLDEKEIGKAIDWFEKHGRMAVLLARLVPTVRTLISLPAGMARMPLVPFLIYSAIGTALWTGLLAASGFWLQENYTLVADSVDRASSIIIGLIVLLYVWRLLAGGRLGDRVRNWAETLRRDVYAVYLATRDPRVPWYAKGFVLMVAIRREPDRPRAGLHSRARPGRRRYPGAARHPHRDKADAARGARRASAARCNPR
jgi:membrane protein DedA with SNARE-associated domain